MSAPVRRAGRARLDDGSEIIWTVADGGRGRRWRARTIRDGLVVEALLLEVGVDGRPTRLELAASAGLLTLHPEPTGGLHGNVVTGDGVRHLSLAWSDDHELAIDRLPIADAVTVRRLASITRVGEGREVQVVAVHPDLEVEEGVRRYRRIAVSVWQIEGAGSQRTVSIDDRGLPVWPASSGERGGEGEPAEWPLEVDPPA